MAVSALLGPRQQAFANLRGQRVKDSGSSTKTRAWKQTNWNLLQFETNLRLRCIWGSVVQRKAHPDFGVRGRAQVRLLAGSIPFLFLNISSVILYLSLE